MQTEIEVNGKKFIVRELLAKELDDANVDWNNPKEAVKIQIVLSTGLTNEEYDLLTMRERLKIQQTFNELNIEDFPQPTK